MQIYNKLVRDNIPEYIESKGEVVRYHIADEAEYETKLVEKLHEELEEFVNLQNTEELADLLEVIEAFATRKGINMSKVIEAKEEKAAKRGRFARRVILDAS